MAKYTSFRHWNANSKSNMGWAPDLCECLSSSFWIGTLKDVDLLFQTRLMFYELGNNYKFVQSWANLPSIVLEKIFLFTVGQNKENGGPCCPRFRCTDARLQQFKSLAKFVFIGEIPSCPQGLWMAQNTVWNHTLRLAAIW